MELTAALEIGKEAIGVGSSLANLIRDSRKPDAGVRPDVSEVISRLQVDAVRLSRDLENRLRTVSDRIADYGLNSAMTINEHYASLSWYNFRSRSRLKGLREECHAIYRQLTTFLDDATAVLICASQQQLAAEAFKNSYELKRGLDRVFLDQKATLGTLMDAMLATASRVTADLQAA